MSYYRLSLTGDGIEKSSELGGPWQLDPKPPVRAREALAPFQGFGYGDESQSALSTCVRVD
jgi:hypothetical protein